MEADLAEVVGLAEAVGLAEEDTEDPVDLTRPTEEDLVCVAACLYWE